MDGNISYNIEFGTNANAVFKDINESLSVISKNTTKVEKETKELHNNLLQFNQFVNVLDSMRSSFSALQGPGIALDSSMHDLSAITGVVGNKLKEIEDNARNTAQEFGISASGAAESYKLILSQLSPEIANNSEALDLMGFAI